MEDALLRWTVRFAVILYLGRVWTEWRLTGKKNDAQRVQRMQRARWLWTAGAVCYLAHVLCAFAFVHDWSHARAYQHTAAETAATTGIDWGGGLYLNYLLTLVWLVDMLAWWLVDIRLPYRSKIYFVLLHGYFAFMFFQATVVFGPPGWKSFALLAAVSAGVAWYVNRKRGGAQ